MLNDELNLTVLERGGRHFFKVQGGEAKPKLKPETDTPELRFKDSIAWSLNLQKYNQIAPKCHKPAKTGKIVKCHNSV